jgi:hypothetical protein
MRTACVKGISQSNGLEGYNFVKRKEDYRTFDLDFTSGLGEGEVYSS